MKRFLGHSIFSLIGVSIFILLSGPFAYGDSAGFVGLQVQGITKEVAQSIGLKSVKGVLVRDIALNGPGNLAGFQRGDLILEFNKKAIKNFGDIVASVQKIRSGQTISVLVSRNHGQEVRLSLKAGTRPASWNITKGDIGNIHDLGLTMAAMTGLVRKKFGVKWGAIGVLVTAVDEATLAGLERLMDLKPGDLILQVDQEKVWLPSQIISKYLAAKNAKRPSLLLLIEGRRGYRFSILPITYKP